MTEDTSLLAAGINTYVGRQVVLLGVMMLAVGIIVGINLVAKPASVQYYSPVLGYTDMPQYLERAATITKAAAVAAVASLGGLVYLDYSHD